MRCCGRVGGEKGFRERQRERKLRCSLRLQENRLQVFELQGRHREISKSLHICIIPLSLEVETSFLLGWLCWPFTLGSAGSPRYACLETLLAIDKHCPQT